MNDHTDRKSERITKAVKLKLDEKLPEALAVRPSRLVDNPGIASIRIHVEELLTRHHGLDISVIQRLNEVEQFIIYRMIFEPAARDYPYRREAVSALAAIGGIESALLLASIIANPNEDEVIVGRALDGLASIGGRGALKLILGQLENSRPYIRNRALKSLFKLKHPDSSETLQVIAKTHQSGYFRRRAADLLAEFGVEVKLPAADVGGSSTGNVKKEE